MKIFLDTSSLFKLYHKEEGTVELEDIFIKTTIDTVYLSEITKIEFASTVWKKVRSKKISMEQAKSSLQLFENDFDKYTFITTDSSIIERAKTLLSTYGIQGLRTLDGIQLATAVSLSDKSDIFITSDNLLNRFFETENLATTFDIS